jgi:hypothetical protein
MAEDTPRLAFAATSVASLLAAVRSALEPSVCLPWENVAAAVSVRADELVQTNRQMAQDAAGEQWLQTSSVILAAYQHLSPVVGAPRLLTMTPLFCALDKVWAEALEQPQYGVRFERPTTLARGDDVCRFQFHKVRTAQHGVQPRAPAHAFSRSICWAARRST